MCSNIIILFLVIGLIAVLFQYWFLTIPAIIISIVVYRHFQGIRLNKKISGYTETDIDHLNGHDFEYFCADILKANSFTDVKVTQKSGDHGIDILATNNGMRYAIQCKRYSSKVGNRAVQEAFSGKVIYNANVAVIITNNYFTPQAEQDARKLGVQLWDRKKLINLFRSAKVVD